MIRMSDVCILIVVAVSFAISGYLWFNGQKDEAMQTWRAGFATNKFNPWGKKCAEVLTTVEQGGEP